jgi:pimeloyl-ACP methyl ester carboxylesterase
LGVTQLVEGVHQSVLATLGLPGGQVPTRTRGLTGLIYKTIRGATRVSGTALDAALRQIERTLAASDANAETPQRAAVLAALNGVLGDRLAAANSSFAIPMTLRLDGQILTAQNIATVPNASKKILLIIHGLCMNDLQWQTGSGSAGQHLGKMLAEACGYTLVSLRYNTGLAIAENGRQLAQQLEMLTQHWPVRIAEIAMLTHSMGGLVARSAAHAAEQSKLAWRKKLKRMVFLGTPHCGAPLERAGHWIDTLLGATPYSAPFAQLTGLRSAGITDLRHGHVADAQPGEPAPHLPLPKSMACYAVAATLAAKRSKLADRLLGDGLVPLASALGQSAKKQRSLAFDEGSQMIFYRTGHLQLLSSSQVAQQLLAWFEKP